MKKLEFVIIVLIAFLTIKATAQNKRISAEKSKISWAVEKVMGKHEGTINIKGGVFTFKEGKLIGGEVIVDMNSVQVMDLKTDKDKKKVEEHLKAEDFFDTDKYPNSQIVFKSVKLKSHGIYTVTGDFTIKRITKPVIFDMKIIHNTATTTFKVKRNQYDIIYGSKKFYGSIGNKAISDEFKLTMNLVFIGS